MCIPGASRTDSIDGIRVFRVGNDWTFAWLCALNLRRWVREHRPDVVVEDLNKLPFYSPLVYRGPLVVQMHHLWRGSIFREVAWPIAGLIWLAEKSIRWVYRDSVFSVVSPSTKGELVEMGLPEKSIEVIYNGADLKAYHPVRVQSSRSCFGWDEFSGIRDRFRCVRYWIYCRIRFRSWNW